MSALELGGRRFVITGVLTRASIAFAVADQLQRLGAQVVLTGFGRTLRMTERAAGALPDPAPVIPLDVTSPDDLVTLADRVGEHMGAVEGLLHSIAFAPPEAMDGDFVGTDPQPAATAFSVSAYSLGAVVGALRPLMRAAEEPGAGVVGLSMDASRTWPSYDWMGVAKAALESLSRYLARDLAAERIRCNLVSSGPLRTPAAGGVAGFEGMLSVWQRSSPLRWEGDEQDAVAQVACYLLSPWSAGVTGEVVHADGGMHALGAAEVVPDISAPSTG